MKVLGFTKFPTWEMWFPNVVFFCRLLWLGSRVAGDAHAPCYNCEIYEMMQHDQAFHDRQVQNNCHYPCKCPNKEYKCKAGVSLVKDGCDCCYMCARQQGDLCDKKDKCDEKKGLYCDFKLDGGLRGLCRAKSPKPCKVNLGKEHKVYKDGEEFKPNCSRLCSCQNGQYACSSLCPQEDRMPSSIHCRDPQLVEISGRCCKEWVCPHSHSRPDPDDHPTNNKPNDFSKVDCKKETIPWSPCSVTCGMGVSMRITNDNVDCQPVQERRLCLVRPCELNDKHLKGRRCKNTWKQVDPFQFHFEGCESIKEFRPKYCSTCKKGRCCTPDKTETREVEFRCEDDKVVLHDFMWTKSCKCHKEC